MIEAQVTGLMNCNRADDGDPIAGPVGNNSGSRVARENTCDMANCA